MTEPTGVVSVSRRIQAPADRIFAVLADPARHTELDGSGMLRGVASGDAITAVGDRFVMKMFFDRFGGDYLMDNHVVEFEPGRRIAWAPAAGDERAGSGTSPVGVPVGHRWSFELSPDGEATVVTETYDCSEAPERLRRAVDGGETWRSAMEQTLVKLEQLCATSPTSQPVTRHVDVLAALIGAGDAVVLSGAGLSTESGIPDYRGPTGLARGATPMTYQEFTGSPAARQRYWARSHLGWRTIAQARPNRGHRAIAALQRAGLVCDVITQNVDGLHSAAGTGRVIDLHGRLDRVTCLECRVLSSRDALDRRLHAANPDWSAGPGLGVRPDGDAAVAAADVERFVVVDCEGCGGRLKPDVVFFGEYVPKERVDAGYAAVAAARSLLVLGSSLTVASGYRFVRHAARLGVPIAIVNQGTTRADDLAAIRLDAPLGEALAAVSRRARSNTDDGDQTFDADEIVRVAGV